jgi:phospholipid/cholesterol/gamma-HCH transport system permease protein
MVKSWLFMCNSRLARHFYAVDNESWIGTTNVAIYQWILFAGLDRFAAIMAFPLRTRGFLIETGNIAKFAIDCFTLGIKPRYEVKEFLSQCYLIGYKSIGLVTLTAFILGLVLTMELQPNLAKYGLESKLPMMVGIAIIREIGPVITALIFAGKVGSSIGAELSSMKVTEQIDAMEVSGTNPVKYLVATRILACMLMLPVLTIIGDGVSIFGAFAGFNISSSIHFHLFLSGVFQRMSYGDIFPSIIKTFFFGFIVGLIGCYKGYSSNSGTRGVGVAANTAVVLSSILIFLIDLLAVQITNLLRL